MSGRTDNYNYIELNKYSFSKDVVKQQVKS